MSKMIASILYCHERNVCHRDVKLDNFVYESNGEDAELKLIDFGLSHVLLHTQVRARVGARVRVRVLAGAHRVGLLADEVGERAEQRRVGVPRAG